MSDIQQMTEPSEQPSTAPDPTAHTSDVAAIDARSPGSDSELSTQNSEPNPLDEFKARDLESRVIEVLRTIFDPEIPVNIYEMGLVYSIRTNAQGMVFVQMTLTSPACPVAGSLPGEVEQKIKNIQDVTAAQVEIVWDPPWTPEKMSEAAKLQLGFM